MGNLVYDRQTKHWDLASLHAMRDAGQATLDEALGIWVVKQDDGTTVAVRPHQIIVFNDMTQDECDAEAKAEFEAENAWLHHAEQGDWAEAELERKMDTDRGVVDFETAWDLADPVHAAKRTLRHAGRAAYETALAEAKGFSDDIPEGRVEELIEQILVEQGTTTAAEEAKIAAAVTAQKQASLIAQFTTPQEG